jgi:hypothetical protein
MSTAQRKYVVTNSSYRRSAGDKDDTAHDARTRFRDTAGLSASTMNWKYEESPRLFYYENSQEALRVHSSLNDFRLVDPDDINELCGITQTVPELANVRSMLLQIIVGGTIKFRHLYGKPISKRTQDALSVKWTKFTQDFYTTQWEIGFVPVVWQPDATLYGVPVVLDPRLMEIRVNHSVTGDVRYLYRRKQSISGTSSLSQEALMIPEVMTFTDERYGPGLDGKIRSRCRLAKGPLDEIASRKIIRSIQEAKALQPTHYIIPALEKDEVIPSEESIQTERFKAQERKLTELQGRAVALQNMTNGGPSPVQRMEPTRRRDYDSKTAAVYNEVRQHLAELPYDRRRLMEGETVVMAPPPNIPTNIYEESEYMYQVIARIFDIPPSQLKHFATTQEWVAEVRDHIAHESQRKWKQSTKAILESLYHVIYDERNLHDYFEWLKETGHQSDSAHAAIENATAIDIKMPSMPNKADMLAYYKMGKLTDAAFNMYLVNNHDLRLEDLHVVPKPPKTEYTEPPAAPAGTTPAKKANSAPASTTTTSNNNKKRTKPSSSASSLKEERNDRPNGKVKV